MALNTSTTPNTYMAGYSAIPLRINNPDFNDFNSYRYITNIIWDEVTVTSLSPVNINNVVYTKCITSSNHNFNLGDIVLIDDSANGNTRTDYYNIVKIDNPTSFVIDVIFESQISNNITASRVIKYLMPPDVDGDAKLDLSNTLKDFVTQNLKDTNEIYGGPDTRFGFGLVCGEEYKYVAEFDSAVTTGSHYEMVFTGTTSVDDVDFKVGDEIQITQNLTSWEFYDNQFESGNLAFIGSTSAPEFDAGTQVLVVGQEHAADYNGYVGVYSATTNLIITEKPFTTNTPADDGTIYGLLASEYNTTGNVTAVSYAGGSVTVTTDIPTGKETTAGGTARYADNRISLFTNRLDVGDFNAYNARIENLDYSISAFDNYVCQDRAAAENNISTILGNKERYTIEKETKSWLLVHSYDNSLMWNPKFSFYDSSNNLISQYRLALDYIYGPKFNINTFSNNGGNVRVVGTVGSVHNLAVGDFVELFQTQDYNGVWEVIQINSAKDFTINAVYNTNIVLGADNYRKITTSDYYDYYFPVGINQIIANTNKTLITGSTINTIADDISYYKVELEVFDSNKYDLNSNPIYYKVNDDCTAYDMLHLMWKDAKGSWLSMPFKYKSRLNLEVERNTYYKGEGNWDNNSYGYNSYDRGEKNYYLRARESKVVNSGFLEDFEVDLIRDLFQSPAVYLQQPNGDIIGCMIDGDTIELSKTQNNEMNQYQFTVIYSSNNYRF